MKTFLQVLILLIGALTTPNVSSAQWIQQNSGTTERSTTAIAVGSGSIILKTTNSGATWNWVPLPISSFVDWNAVSFFDALQGTIAGRNALATTVDGGERWNFYYLEGSGECLSAIQIGPGNIYAGDDSGRVYHSLDTGKTWTSEKISDWPILALFAWRGAYITGLPVYALTPFSLFAKMEFPGGAWKETILPFHGLGSAAMSGEFCKGGGPGFIVGVQGDFIAAPTIVRQSAGDTVWKILATDIPFGGTLFDVSAPSEQVVYVCGNNRTIYKSVDAGDAWTACVATIPHILYAIEFFDEKRGFAVGDSGTILYTSDGGVTGIGSRRDRIPEGYVLDQNYPNPFNPATIISYRLPVTSKIGLKVYNLLGQEVLTLFEGVRPAGEYEAIFDGSKLASGIYVCLLTANNFAAVKKLLLLK
jgi:photosystem II stability/assembly factor-like uncharacterized protein